MEKEKIEGFVKKETLITVSVIMFIIGFIAGAVFTVYKSGPPLSVQQQEQSHMREQVQVIPDEIAKEINELEEKTSNSPDDLESWKELGHLYFYINNFDKAIWAYNKSLELDPDNADIITDLGIMYRRSGNPSEAIKSFDKAININPNHENARLNKGIVLMHDLNDIDGAIKAWEDLIKLNPEIKTSDGIPIKKMIQSYKSTHGMGEN